MTTEKQKKILEEFEKNIQYKKDEIIKRSEWMIQCLGTIKKQVERNIIPSNSIHSEATELSKEIIQLNEKIINLELYKFTLEEEVKEQ